MNIKLIALTAGLISAAPAFSATLDFDHAGAYNFIGDYYNGGTNDAGASGSNFGASFGPDALVIANDEYFSYYSNAPTPGVLAAVGADSALNISAGFSGDFSFWYSASEATSVSIFSGLNGTGTLLGTIALQANTQNGCSDTAYCHWDQASLNLSDIAQSIQFGNTAGLAGFDNVTFTAVPVPAAGWMMLSALGGLGAVVRRKRNA